MAVSPAIPDPRLNTAECVIKDHDPKELDTRHSYLKYSMFFCSFISVMLLGPLLAHLILEFLKNYPEKTSSFCFWKEKPIVHAADSTVFVMLLVEIPFIIYTFAKSCKTELSMIFIIVFIGIITTEGPVIVFILKWKKYNQGNQVLTRTSRETAVVTRTLREAVVVTRTLREAVVVSRTLREAAVVTRTLREAAVVTRTLR